MKVLSLGCGDGYLEHWLSQQLDLEWFGVESDERAAERARTRGIDCRVGRAEDALTMWPAHTFDAVVAFELLEHVPSVPDLLHTCEQLLAPEGTIYLSTPDGTFGRGSNPNHLRALRSVDFADLLRERGTLSAFAVGADGVSVAAYRPARKLKKVGIYCGPGPAWHPMDIETRGLGGSETAAFRLGEALASMGHVVTLFGEFAQSGAMCDLILRHWRSCDPSDERDLFISSRHPEIFDGYVNAQTKLLWMHDTDYGDVLNAERAARIDAALVLSKWHEGHVRERYPFLERVEIVRNGLALPYYAPTGAHRELRAVYSSSPDRGLDLLLEMWPEVQAKVPQAKLTYAYPGYFEVAAQSDRRLRELRERIVQMTDEQEGVHSAGSLSLPDLAQLLRSSRVWVHPSFCSPHSTVFMETSCIGALEAQASGCQVVASAHGALPETVVHGTLVRGCPGARWRREFVAAIVRALTSEDAVTLAELDGPEAVKASTWQAAAQRVAEITGLG